jgi:hypothetical protein
MKRATVQPQDKYILRLPDGMRDRIRTAADDNNRSMNAEIVARLGKSFVDERVQEDYSRRINWLLDALASKDEGFQNARKALEAGDFEKLREILIVYEHFERSGSEVEVRLDRAISRDPESSERG